MRRFWILFLALVFAVIVANLIRREPDNREGGLRSEETTERQRGYELTLKHYSDRFKTGLTRKNVEIGLRVEGIKFSQSPRGTSEDFVKIGEEDAHPSCSEKYIYVVFEFEPRDQRIAMDTDVLAAVRLDSQVWGCL